MFQNHTQDSNTIKRHIILDKILNFCRLLPKLAGRISGEIYVNTYNIMSRDIRFKINVTFISWIWCLILWFSNYKYFLKTANEMLCELPHQNRYEHMCYRNSVSGRREPYQLTDHCPFLLLSPWIKHILDYNGDKWISLENFQVHRKRTVEFWRFWDFTLYNRCSFVYHSIYH